MATRAAELVPTPSATGSGGNRTTPSVRAHWPLWIDGTHAAAADGERLSIENPATGVTFCEAECATATDVDRAVRAAQSALPAWSAWPTARRVRVMFDLAQRIRDAEHELALLETLDNGKPLRDSRQDVEKTAEAFEFYGGIADKLFGTTIPTSPELLNYTLREPVGVTAHISPWNYPLRLSMRSVAPALAAGNTVVLKPAEQTPLTALRVAELAHDVGLPHGVLNVVPGHGRVAGAALAGHRGVNHIAFTGSITTGIDVMQRAARNVVPVTLELGGKSPNIVFADANLQQAAAGAAKAIFTNAGQVCCAGSRLLLEASIHDEFVAMLIDLARRIRVGPGINDPDMGPLVSRAQHERVLACIERARNEGGDVLHGGGRPDTPACRGGYFVEPTLIGGLHNATCTAQEEIFGPVLTILSFHSEDEAVQIANDSPYGLVAGVWTANLSRAHRLAARLIAGQIYVNDFFSGSVASPFGGCRRSGFGRERGVEAMQHYTQTKSICVRLED